MLACLSCVSLRWVSLTVSWFRLGKHLVRSMDKAASSGSCFLFLLLLRNMISTFATRVAQVDYLSD